MKNNHIIFVIKHYLNDNKQTKCIEGYEEDKSGGVKKALLLLWAFPGLAGGSPPCVQRAAAGQRSTPPQLSSCKACKQEEHKHKQQENSQTVVNMLLNRTMETLKVMNRLYYLKQWHHSQTEIHLVDCDLVASHQEATIYFEGIMVRAKKFLKSVWLGPWTQYKRTMITQW